MRLCERFGVVVVVLMQSVVYRERDCVKFSFRQKCFLTQQSLEFGHTLCVVIVSAAAAVGLLRSSKGGEEK